MLNLQYVNCFELKADETKVNYPLKRHFCTDVK